MNCQAAMLPPQLTNMEKKDMDEKVTPPPPQGSMCFLSQMFSQFSDFSRTTRNPLKDI